MKIVKRTISLTLTALLLCPNLTPLIYGAGQRTPGVTRNNAQSKHLLREGTEVKLKFAQSLSSKTATANDQVNLVLAEDVRVGRVVVARADAQAVGTISHAKRSGRIGKGGELGLQLDYLKVGAARIKLRGSQGKEGNGKEGTAIALTVLFGPLGLLKRGKEVEVKEGTLLTAYVDRDISLPVDR